MAKLAITGHKTRGKEVIEILEMLGGYNYYNLSGKNGIDTVGYCIGQIIPNIVPIRWQNKHKYISFTLEGFLEKFPYKVGDSVSSKYLKNYKIEKAEWVSSSNKVVYKLQGVGWHSVEDLQPYKEETVEETDTMNHTTEINLNHPCFKGCNEIEIIIPDGWEFKQRDNKMFGVRKQYPKTYAECAKILKCFSAVHIDGYRRELLEKLQELIVCRDAYWKIAGEQMGLDKPWVPDWNQNTEKYVIYPYRYLFSIDKENYRNTVLAFPTKEMRDAFYENFMDLIEECKKFL